MILFDFVAPDVDTCQCQIATSSVSICSIIFFGFVAPDVLYLPDHQRMLLTSLRGIGMCEYIFNYIIYRT